MYDIYDVNDIDTIDSVASLYDISSDELRKINGLDPYYELARDMQLMVPKINKNPYSYYTVKKGDTPSQIAKDYGVDYALFLQLNGLDENDYIYPNQTLMLPGDGYDIYLTQDNDTLESVSKKIGEGIEGLILDNPNIFLREGQIIVFRKK